MPRASAASRAVGDRARGDIDAGHQPAMFGQPDAVAALAASQIQRPARRQRHGRRLQRRVDVSGPDPVAAAYLCSQNVARSSWLAMLAACPCGASRDRSALLHMQRIIHAAGRLIRAGRGPYNGSTCPHGLAVRTPAFHAGDRRFEPGWGYFILACKSITFDAATSSLCRQPVFRATVRATVGSPFRTRNRLSDAQVVAFFRHMVIRPMPGPL